MPEKIEKKRLAILRILRNAGKPLASRTITEQLVGMGFDISERTVRFHLLAMDNDGLTEYVGRQGRQITPKGSVELSKTRIFEKIGFLTAKIDQMTYRMNFDLAKRTGSVVINVSIVRQDILEAAAPLIGNVYEKGYAMGTLLALFESGQMIGDNIIPDGFIGIGTVCSITLNGVLLAHGVPTKSRFGGILEIEDSQPTRFVAIINYDGTSIDPLEIFIKSGMTDYIGATGSGNGLIGASFREFPSGSHDHVAELAHRLEDVGLGGFMEIGWPSQSLHEIPVSEGMVGAIVIGGLNPVAILVEHGFEVYSNALSGLVDYNRLFPYTELPERIRSIIRSTAL